MQVSVYEHQQLADLTEFFTVAERVLPEPQLQAILHSLLVLRPDSLESRIDD